MILRISVFNSYHYHTWVGHAIDLSTSWKIFSLEIWSIFRRFITCFSIHSI